MIFVFLSVILALFTALAHAKKWPPFDVYVIDPVPPPIISPTRPETAPEPTQIPITPNTMPTNPDSVMYPWDTDKHNFHNARVLFDKALLSVDEKNLLCSVIYQESDFWNILPSGKPVRNDNVKNGKTTSSDWGLLQVNDFFHIGAGKDFPSVEYVLANPDEVVQWFIRMYKQGQLYQWSSYRFGVNKQWLAAKSPMWALHSEV